MKAKSLASECLAHAPVQVMSHVLYEWPDQVLANLKGLPKRKIDQDNVPISRRKAEKMQ